MEAVAQQIVTDVGARRCSYSRDLITISRQSSPMVVGKEALRDLQGWLSPPDPSTNHNIACGAQHERTSLWLFKDNIFKEWELNGSLLWIHGKRTVLTRRGLIVPDGFFYSGLGEERPLVRHSIISSCTEAHILIQLCNHPAYRSST